MNTEEERTGKEEVSEEEFADCEDGRDEGEIELGGSLEPR